MKSGLDRIAQRLSQERLLIWMANHRWVVFAVLLVIVAAPQFGRTDGDWTFFEDGSELLRGVERSYFPRPGGLALYANYPEIQIGPAALLAATPFVLLGDDGWRWASLVLLVAVLPLIRLIEASQPAVGDVSGDGPRWTSLIGGTLVVAGWVPLAGAYLHGDDAIAIAAGIGAIVLVRRGRSLGAGALIGLACAAKPWAVLFVPLLIAGWQHGVEGRRRTVVGVAVSAAVCGLFWGPFVVGEPATLEAMRPQVDVSIASVLHLFGVPLGLGPEWVRLAQLLTAGSMVAVAGLRGRWEGVPVVAVAARLVLDPGTYPYYTSGLLVFALLWDVSRGESVIPVVTLSAFAFLALPSLTEAVPEIRAVLRLLGCVVVCAQVLAGRCRANTTPAVARTQHSPVTT